MPAVNASISPGKVAVDAFGDVYFTSDSYVFMMDAQGVLVRIAGLSYGAYGGESGPALDTPLNAPAGVAVDRAGNVYVAEFQNNCVRRIGADGVISTFAGGGTGSDNGPAASAELWRPYGIAVDASGSVFIAELGTNRVRKVAPNGIITTVAGNGTSDFSGDGGPATGAALNQPYGIAVDSSGNLYIADCLNSRIRKVTADGIIHTIAGNGNSDYTGDNGPALSASLYYPRGVAVDAAGNVYIADTVNNCIRKVALDGNITTVAGDGGHRYSGDNVQATASSLAFPGDVAVNPSGIFYIADSIDNRVRRVASNGVITTVAGDGSFNYSGDGGLASLAQLSAPESVALDSLGNVYIADTQNQRIRRIDPNGILTTVAGDGTAGSGGDNGPALQAQFDDPVGVAVGTGNNIFVADTSNNRIRMIASGDDTISTVTSGNPPWGLSSNPAGDLFFPDGAAQIFEFVPGVGASVVAGNGTAGYNGDNISATSAELNHPRSAIQDASGNLYIADTLNNRVRKVDSSGNITTIAGTGTAGYSGDGGQAANAQLDFPQALAVDPCHNLYIADQRSLIRKIDQSGVITTIRIWPNSNGDLDDYGLGSPGRLLFSQGTGLASDATCSIFVADNGYNRIRVLTPIGTKPVLLATFIDPYWGKVFPGQGVEYDVLVTNALGALPTSGTVSVTELPPASLSSVTMSGIGWWCSNGTCTRSDPLAAGTSYPPIRVTANVASNAVYQVTNQISVTGGGSQPASARVTLTLWNSLALFVSSVGSGSLTAIPPPPPDGAYPKGTHVCLTATPSVGFVFAGWVFTDWAFAPIGVPLDSSNCFVLTTNAAVTASFVSVVSLDQSKLYFGATNRGAVVTAPQKVQVTASPGASWSVSSSKSYIVVSPTSGTGSGSFTVSIQRTTLPSPSTQQGTITVTAPAASNSPQTVQVSVKVMNDSSTGSPFGSFDTPANNTTGISGSVAVTGWALDNIGVQTVQIWRNPIGSEPTGSNGLIYIGDATFVPGARPDVQSAYSSYPLNNRAGWGYLMLTNGLPNNGSPTGLGNGTYTLHAIATSIDGKTFELGTKTINCDNGDATIPFGAIDTPGQGETVSGTIVNFGWALTPQPYSIPTDGSTITVTVDGVTLGHPVYNQYRSDIATGFPGYANANGAVGYFSIDTTTLSNGIHTIGWLVYDNNGKGAGIGSRFFWVQN